MKFDKKTPKTKWTFKKGSVVKNFDAHISKSVPRYIEFQELTVLTDFFKR